MNKILVSVLILVLSYVKTKTVVFKCDFDDADNLTACGGKFTIN